MVSKTGCSCAAPTSSPVFVTSGSRPWVTSSLGLIQKEDDNLLLLCLTSLSEVAGNERIPSFLGHMWMLTHCHMTECLFFSLCSFYTKYTLRKGLGGCKVRHTRLQEKPELGFLWGSISGFLVRVHQEARSKSCFLLSIPAEHSKMPFTHGADFSHSLLSRGDRLGAWQWGQLR